MLSRVEPLNRAMANFIGLHGFRWYLQFDTSEKTILHTFSLPCVYALFRLISIARYAVKSPRICS